MINQINFTKMHGAGNDYIYIDTRKYPLTHPEELSIRLSAPHTGIGSDGLVLIGDSLIADFSMRIFNADGSEALMCGNASRCIGKYVYEKGLTDKTTIRLETLSGIKELHLQVKKGKVTEVTVDMGTPVIKETSLDIPVGSSIFTGSVVSMGNPHLVIFAEDIDRIDLAATGPLLENHTRFQPERTNVEFVQILTPSRMRMRVWERGSGITQACGTGACASAVAAIFQGKSGSPTEVIMDGGLLTIRWDPKTGKVWMKGDATTVFEGSIEIE